jgi:hypothetical protein
MKRLFFVLMLVAGYAEAQVGARVNVQNPGPAGTATPLIVILQTGVTVVAATATATFTPTGTWNTWTPTHTVTNTPVFYPTVQIVSEAKTVVPMPTTWAVSEVKTVVPLPTTWAVAPVYPNAVAGNLNPSGTATVVPMGLFAVTTPGTGFVMPIGGLGSTGDVTGVQMSGANLRTTLFDGVGIISSSSVSNTTASPGTKSGLFVRGALDMRNTDGTLTSVDASNPIPIVQEIALTPIGPTNPVPVTDQSATALEAVTLLRAIATSVAAP